MNRSVKYCFLVFMGLAASLYSQTNSPSMERITVFGEYHDPSLPAVETSVPEANIRPVWILKFSPTLLVRGELPLFVERKISSRWGLEVAAGVTFLDYLKQTIFLSQPLFQGSPNEERLSGVVAKAGIHYYLGRKTPSALYLAPQIEFKNYRKDVHGVYLGDDGRYASGKLRDRQTYVDFKAILGHQSADEFDRDFFFDWFIGAGLRLGNEDNVGTDELKSNIIKVRHVNVLRPVITAGVKLCLGV